jgi:hypothetical protein
MSKTKKTFERLLSIHWHKIMDRLRDQNWGGLPWRSPITHWTDAENEKLSLEIQRRVRALKHNETY